MTSPAGTREARHELYKAVAIVHEQHCTQSEEKGMAHNSIGRCGICLDDFQEPRALPCLHSFCTACLEGLCRQEQTRCPECRKAFVVPSDGVQGFPINFYLLARNNPSQSMAQDFLKCSTCESNSVVYLRQDTLQLMCETCREQDTSESSTRSLSADLQENPVCAKHSKRITSYCSPCRVLLCSCCALEAHGDHSRLDINQMAENPRQNLIKEIDETRKKRLQVLDCVRSTTLVEQRLEQAREKARDSVRQVFAQMAQETERYKQALLLEMEAGFSRKLSALQEGKKEGESLLERASRLCSDAEQFLADSRALKLLTCGNDHLDVHCLRHQLEVAHHTLRDIESTAFGQGGATFVKHLEDMVDRLQQECLDSLLSTTQAYAPNCSLSALPHGALLPHKEYSVVLSCFSGLNTPVIADQMPLTVHLYHDSGKEGVVSAIVKKSQMVPDHDISFYFPTNGMYQLHVKVNGKHVKGSPSVFQVTSSCSQVSRLHRIISAPPIPSTYATLALSRAGDIAASNKTRKSVDLFDRDGHFVRRLGQGKLGEVGNGLTFDLYGNILVTDKGNRCIRKFTTSGHYLGKFGSYGSKAGHLINPSGLACHIDGTLYVTDVARDRIFVYSADGKLVREIGSYGNGPLHFQQPSSVAVGLNGHIFVADQGNNRIQVISQEGEFLHEIAKISSGQEAVKHPTHVSVTDEGIVLVSEEEAGRIQLFMTDGGFVRCLDGRSGFAIPSHPCATVATEDHKLFVISSSQMGIRVFV